MIKRKRERELYIQREGMIKRERESKNGFGD